MRGDVAPTSKLVPQRKVTEYQGVAITDTGWGWLTENQSKFILHKKDKNKSSAGINHIDDFDDGIPF